MNMSSPPAANVGRGASDKEESTAAADNRSIKTAANHLLEDLRSKGQIKTERELIALKSSISEYLNFLPGHFTPQKYTGIDTDSKIDVVVYGRILEEVVEKFNCNWPLQENKLDSVVVDLFAIDSASMPIFTELLTVITSALKSSINETVAFTMGRLLELVLTRDCLFSAIVDACRAQDLNAFEQEELCDTWRGAVQILVSLPNRVANTLKTKTFDTFLPQNYVKCVSFHIGRAIRFLNESLSHSDVTQDLKPLALLMSKLIKTADTENLAPLLTILSEWCAENQITERRFIKGVLEELDCQSIEPVAVFLLKSCNPKYGVHHIFGDLISHPSWKHSLITKITCMRYYDNETLIINLVAYLAAHLNDNRILIELLIKLINIWADKSAFCHTSLDQHIYVTKLIVLATAKSKNHLRHQEKLMIHKLLVSGVSAHLESTLSILQTIGKAVAEILFKILLDSSDAPTFKFEYENISTEELELVSNLRKLTTIKDQVDREGRMEKADLEKDGILFHSIGDRNLYELGVECKILHRHIVAKVVDDEENEVDLSKQTALYKSAAVGDAKNENSNENESELDSDDDLVPYDMSSDIKGSVISRPKFLRELRDNLVDANASMNPEIFSACMEDAEDLILSQLPTDDASFAVELLEIFVNLKEHSYVQNFYILQFRSCVAILTVYPKECAEHLCHLFYMPFERYSVKERLLFLETLAEAARKLSTIPRSKSEEIESAPTTSKKRVLSQKIPLSHEYFSDFEKPETQATDWRDIVDERIRANTKRYFNSAKPIKAFENKFANVASSFFYPLLHGYGKQGTYFASDLKIFLDQQNILLVMFLQVLSTIMVAAQNCLIASKMAGEILALSWTLRNHEEVKVRLAVLENIAAVMITVPEKTIRNEMLRTVLEIQMWLVDEVQDAVTGDQNKDCRILAAKVIQLIKSKLSS